MDLICNDVRLIVYRYIHRSHLTVVNDEYTIKFKCCWDNLMDVGRHEATCYNYRPLVYDAPIPIYKFHDNLKTGMTSKNYMHAVLY